MQMSPNLMELNHQLVQLLAPDIFVLIVILFSGYLLRIDTKVYYMLLYKDFDSSDKYIIINEMKIINFKYIYRYVNTMSTIAVEK